MVGLGDIERRVAELSNVSTMNEKIALIADITSYFAIIASQQHQSEEYLSVFSGKPKAAERRPKKEEVGHFDPRFDDDDSHKLTLIVTKKVKPHRDFPGERVRVTTHQFSNKNKRITEIYANYLRLQAETAPKQVSGLASKVREALKKIPDSVRKTLVGLAFGGVIASAAYIMGQPRQISINRLGRGGREARIPQGLKPEAIIGYVPLYSIQYMERAKSDRKLKNRAIGDVFLAHQKGNKDILRIDGTLQGPFRFWYLWLLILLQSLSEGKEKNLLDMGKGTINLGGIGSAILKKKAIKANEGVLNYETHKTFPIITQFAILTDMYLQTIEWHRTVEDGQGVIKYHLLFRKWIPSESYKVFNPIIKDGKVIKASHFIMSTGKLGTRSKQLEFTIDFIWKMMRMQGEIYGHMLIDSDGKKSWEIDREAVGSMKRLVTSYSGKLFGILSEPQFIAGTRAANENQKNKWVSG